MGIARKVVAVVKHLLYGDKGEPYHIAGHTLRYTPGSRPVRLKYATKATDGVARYDALEIKTLLAGMTRGDTVLDIGAHHGQYCILMSALGGPESTVIAFEPDYHARQALARNIALNPMVKAPQIESFAVTDSVGRATFYSKGGNSNSSLAASATGGDPNQENEAFEVELITLDSYLKDRDLHPAWVKIDTEGAEIRILKGAADLLQTDCNFLVELHPYAWAEFGNSFEELQTAVSACGRRMRYLDSDQELTADPIYGVVVLER